MLYYMAAIGCRHAQIALALGSKQKETYLCYTTPSLHKLLQLKPTVCAKCISFLRFGTFLAILRLENRQKMLNILGSINISVFQGDMSEFHCFDQAQWQFLHDLRLLIGKNGEIVGHMSFLRGHVRICWISPLQ